MNRLRALASWTGACLALAACAPASPPDAWPEGAVIAGRGAALVTLLAQLQRLEGTPLARRAEAIAGGLGACQQVEGRDPAGSLAQAAQALGCAGAEGRFAAVHAWRGDRDLAFALPLEGGARIRGAASLSAAGDVDVELSLPRDAFGDARRLFLPGTRPAGAGVLSGDERLVHLRLRPDSGLDLASLIPAGGQAEQLFRLKSGLFQGLVLDGTWEAALYVPEPGRPMPRAALALGFTSRRAAQIAMDGFVEEIESTWPVRRTAFSVGAATGTCFPELKLLPDLAPCYVATERALVIGWNPASVRKALDGAAGGADDGGAGGFASAELARFAEADARLTALAREDAVSAPIRWPWRRAVADGTRDGNRVRIRVHLESRGGA
jgi:hypothetical protein